MLIDTRHARLQLGKGDHLRIRGAGHACLTAVSGVVWITVDREARDILVHPGESFVAPTGKTMLVGPLLGPVTLELQVARGAATGAVQSR